MARYSGPKGRVNRRLQSLIYETSGAAKALEKRGNQPPGMHTRFPPPIQLRNGVDGKAKDQALLRPR